MPFRKPIGYLVSKFPAVTHTFIQREIDLLRSKGFDLFVASINDPDSNSENDQIFYVKRQGAITAFIELFKAILSRPLGLIKGVLYAIRIAGTDLKMILRHLFYVAEALLVAKWMKQNHLEQLHVHFANPAAKVALLVSKIYQYPYSLTIHGPDEFYDVTINNIEEKTENASAVFCISNYTRSQILRLVSPEIWPKIKINYLGIDPSIYTPHHFQNKSETFQILCVARLSVSKGQRILIQAVKILIDQGKKIKLTLVGEGPDRRQLERWVNQLSLSEHVEFKGALNPGDTLKCYQFTDVFVLTSFAEGLPVVLMEAMSMEIPCIATAINGIPELIQNNLNGILVSPANTEETSNAILRFIEDPDCRLKLGKAGRAVIVEKFNLDRNINALANFFEHGASDE